MRRPSYYGDPYRGHESITPRHVCYLDLRGITFQVSSTVLGLFPESVLTAMFPGCFIYLFDIYSGSEAATTVLGLRMAARDATRMGFRNNVGGKCGETGAERHAFLDPSLSSGEDDLLAEKSTTSDEEKRPDSLPVDEGSTGGGSAVEAVVADSWDAESSVGSSDDRSESQLKTERDAAFHPVDVSSQMPLGVPGGAIYTIDFDPVMFTFFMNYFCERLDETDYPVPAVKPFKDDRIQENGTLDPVLVDTPEPLIVKSVDSYSAPTSADSKSTPHTPPEEAPFSIHLKRPPTTRRGSIAQIARKVVDLKLTITSFFGGQEAEASLGPLQTPLICSVPPEFISTPAPLRTPTSIVVLREELEYFPIVTVLEDEVRDATPAPCHGVWETLKGKIRSSFSRESSSKSLDVNEGVAAPMVASVAVVPSVEAGLELSEVSTAVAQPIVALATPSSALPTTSETIHVKKICETRLLDAAIVAGMHGEMGLDVLARYRAHTGLSESGGILEGVTEPRVQRDDRNVAVAGDESEKLTVKDLIHALDVVCPDFSPTATLWDFRAPDAGKNKICSVAILGMKPDVPPMSRDQECANLTPSQPPPPANVVDVPASNLVTQVTNPTPTTPIPSSFSHLERIFSSRRETVRKCWWEVIDSLHVDSPSNRQIQFQPPPPSAVPSCDLTGIATDSPTDPALAYPALDDTAPIPSRGRRTSLRRDVSCGSNPESEPDVGVGPSSVQPRSPPSSPYDASAATVKEVSGPGSRDRNGVGEEDGRRLEAKVWIRRTWTIEFCAW
ncbi:hypothetical protein HKX48_008342 [Thoreauomyces humboldtii]|nr:hypothetical protein HKX48_008342 [Thoreauomyces humboldtii]